MSAFTDLYRMALRLHAALESNGGVFGWWQMAGVKACGRRRDSAVARSLSELDERYMA